MSTEEHNDANEAIYAKLVRGRIYILGETEFEFDVEKECTPEQRAWLEIHAVDLVSLESEGEHQERQKFEFSVRPRGDKAKAANPSPRSRSR